MGLEEEEEEEEKDDEEDTFEEEVVDVYGKSPAASSGPEGKT
jgi:hypothetical protein